MTHRLSGGEHHRNATMMGAGFDLNPNHKSGLAKLAKLALSYLSPAIFAYIVIESASVICISKAKDANHKPIYNSATVVLAAEFIKLLISIGAEWNEDPGLVKFRANFSWEKYWRFGVPAFLYAVNNNIFLYVLTLIHPSVFQLLLNLRVVWTGIIFKFLLGRNLSKRQWIAMFLLVVGCTIAQYATTTTPSAHTPTKADAVDDAKDKNTVVEADLVQVGRFFLGLVLTLVYTFISTGASVVNEVMIKSAGSLHTANIQLYSFGVFFNLIGMTYQARQVEGGYFRGWSNILTWCVFFSMSFAGLLVSRVMQKYDNIIKIFCVSVSNFVVYFFSVLFDSYPISLSFVLAFFIVSGSALDYQKEKAALEAQAKATGSSGSSGSSTNTDSPGKEYHRGVVVDQDLDDTELSDADAANLLVVTTSDQVVTSLDDDFSEAELSQSASR